VYGRLDRQQTQNDQTNATMLFARCSQPVPKMWVKTMPLPTVNGSLGTRCHTVCKFDVYDCVWQIIGIIGLTHSVSAKLPDYHLSTLYLSESDVHFLGPASDF